MEDLLLNVNVTPHMVYLALILLVIGKGLKDTPIIENYLIIWILMAISIIVNFVFFGVKFETLLEAMVATSIATAIYQTYKQTNEGVRAYRSRRS
jgi:hypothetical protein